MKLAFTTATCPAWDLPTAAGQAKELGFDGVDVFVGANVPSNPAALGQTFADAGVAIACLSSSIATSSLDQQAAEHLRQLIDAASAAGCPLVSIPDFKVPRTLIHSAIAMARWIGPAADHAAAAGVTLLIENTHSFARAADLWMLLETIHHPAVGACWDVLSAALAGETPAIAIPTLNTRIRHVRLRDALLTKGAATLCPLGQGNVRLSDLLHRLQGIGYAGHAAFHGENLSTPDTLLPSALAQLRTWTAPPSKPAPPVKPAKSAAALRPAAV